MRNCVVIELIQYGIIISILMTTTWQVEKYHILLNDLLLPWTNQVISYAMCSLFNLSMNQPNESDKPPAPEEQEKIKNEAAWVSLLKQEIGKVIVGQKYLIDRLIVGLLSLIHI